MLVFPSEVVQLILEPIPHSLGLRKSLIIQWIPISSVTKPDVSSAAHVSAFIMTSSLSRASNLSSKTLVRFLNSKLHRLHS